MLRRGLLPSPVASPTEGRGLAPRRTGRRRAALIAAVLLIGTSIGDADSASAAVYSGDCARKRTLPGADVVLLIGQSNMSGFGYPFKAATDGAATQDPRITQLDRNGAVVAAGEPLQHADIVAYNFPRVGMGTAFARSYLPGIAAQRTVLLVPSAHGATGFLRGDWNPGNALYEQAVTRVTSALALNAGNCLAAVLWHQGESEVVDGATEAQTVANLDRMIGNLRSRVPGARTAPFILGEFTQEWIAATPAVQATLNAIRDTPRRLRYTAVAASAGLPSNARAGYPSDIIHFDARSMRAYGQRYFRALAAAAANR